MDIETKILKAKASLTLSHPYFGMLSARLKHEQKDTISSYASNGKIFLYNKIFLEQRSIEEIIFIFTNSVMHHVLAHQQRRLNRKGSLWQLATDFAINNMLHKNGLKIPIGANYNRDFKDMFAEEIYEVLKEQYFNNSDNAFVDTQNSEEQIFANLKDIEDDLSAEDESEWLYASSVAQEVANRKSAMPSGLERLAKKVKAKDIDWRFELYNAINRHMRNNYAFMPPNKKHIHRGFVLPSLTSDTLSLSVAIDTSGSINDELLGAFIEEFKMIMTSFPTIKIELLIADAKVHTHYTFQGGDKLDFKLKGGGGTDFRPVFDYIDAHIPMNTMLLYFTDGDGWFPKRVPNYEVLWALSRKAKMPFGKVLTIF